MPRDFEVLRHWRPEPASPLETEAMSGLEHGDVEIYRSKLEMLCWEAYETFKRMGISPMIEGGDAAIAIYSRSGDMAVGIMGTQLHLVNGSLGIKWMMRHFYEEPSVGIHEGDMFYTNDPLYGGIHAPDQIVFMPVFWEGDLVAWVHAASHETETGAKEPGGMPPSAKSRYDEGMIISPLRIAENYRLKADVVEMLENGVRDPHMQTHDLKARAAACHLLERRLHGVLEKKGSRFLQGLMRRMIDEGVSTARAKLAAMNDGIYRTEIFPDNAGQDMYGLLNIRVEVEKRGEKCIIRFKGSPRVLDGNVNMFPHTVIAMFAAYLFQFFFWELPATTGMYEPFEFEFQEDSIFTADAEDATSLLVQTLAQMLTAVHVSMEKMKFSSPYHDHVAGSWPGSPVSVALGGVRRDGVPFSGWDQGIPNGQGLGGRWDSDGLDVAGMIFCAIGEFPDSEHLEHTLPIVPVFRSVFMQDAVGFGKYRGGRSMQAMYEVRGVDGLAIVGMGGFANRPLSPGLFGGYSSRPPALTVIRNHNLAELSAKSQRPSSIVEAVERLEGDWQIKHPNSGVEMLTEGDLFIINTSSGPGYGDVLDREPSEVINDLRDGTISHRIAQELFKISYHEGSLILDEAGTEVLRKKERQDRLERATAFSEWEEGWLLRQPPEDILVRYGPWPYPGEPQMMDYEAREELLDAHVRDGGAPRDSVVPRY